MLAVTVLAVTVLAVTGDLPNDDGSAVVSPTWKTLQSHDVVAPKGTGGQLQPLVEPQPSQR